MAKKTERDKLIEIAAKVLSVEPQMLKQALENALEISVLQRNLQLLGDMLKKERLEHEKLETLYKNKKSTCPNCGA